MKRRENPIGRMSFLVLLAFFVLNPLPVAAQTNYWEDIDSIHYYFVALVDTGQYNIPTDDEMPIVLAPHDTYIHEPIFHKELIRIPDHYTGYIYRRVCRGRYARTNQLVVNKPVLGVADFYPCDEWVPPPVWFESNVKEVILPQTLLYIDESAFQGNEHLEKLTFPDSIRYIGTAAFMECNLQYYNEWDRGVLKLPDNCYLGRSAFSGCYLTDVKLPLYMTDIPDYAFSGNRNLKNVVWPQKVERIGRRAFSNCRRLSEIPLSSPTFQHLRTIGRQAFLLCPIKEVDLPIEVDTVQAEAFGDENEVHIIDKFVYKKPFVTDSVTYASKWGEWNEFISILDGRKIENFIIAEDTGLSKLEYNLSPCHIGTLVIPPNIKEIGTGCFGAVDSVVFTSSDLLIRYRAFNGRVQYENNKKSINSYAIIATCLTETPPECEPDAFKQTFQSIYDPPPDARLYMPESAIEVYRNHPEWGKFTTIIGFNPDGIRPVTEKASEIGESWRNLQGIQLPGPPLKPGIYIHNGRKVCIK